MSLNTELSAVRQKFFANGPKPVIEAITNSISELQTTYDKGSAIQVGSKLPDFTLTDAIGASVSSASLLSKGPLLIVFYRGEWCPFCNISLSALQKHVAEIQAKGVTLVAITPELPSNTLSTTEKHELKFPVLSDIGNKFARQLGIVWKMPESLRPVFQGFGHDLVKHNGDDSFEVPIPASLLVNGSGVIKNIFIEPDYTKRLEPATALEWIDAL